MTDRYDGPATLTVATLTVDVTAHLATHVDDYAIRTWEGRATTHDLAALSTARQGGAIILPDGRQGEVHVAHAEVDTVGVLLHLHGAGPEPYA